MQNSDVLIRRVEVVGVHLDALEELISGPDMSSALRASLSLRFLFDGALLQVAHQLGQGIAVRAPLLDGVPVGEAILFACGGYKLDAEVVHPHYTYRVPGIQSVHRAQYERQIARSPSAHDYTDLKLSKFLQQPCLGFAGFTVSREETVRYVANKCGGAHHHDNVKKFSELEMRLTQVGHLLRVNGSDLSAVFLETLGTASLLIASNSIIALRNSISAARMSSGNSRVVP